MYKNQASNPDFVEFIRDDGTVEMRHVNYDALLIHPEVVLPNNTISVEEIQAHNSTKYQRDRQNEYPPITDYLDGIVKGDQAQVDAYIAACQAVKSKYPKPE